MGAARAVTGGSPACITVNHGKSAGSVLVHLSGTIAMQKYLNCLVDRELDRYSDVEAAMVRWPAFSASSRQSEPP